MVIRETFDGFQGRLQIGGRIVTNLRCADTSSCWPYTEAELQELVDRLERVNRKYSLLINVDKIKVMANDVIAYRIVLLIQNEQLEQMDTFPYLGFLITENGECTTEFRTRLNRGQAIVASLQKIWKSHSILIETKLRLMKALVRPVAMYMAVKAGHSERMKKHVCTPSRWRGFEKFSGFLDSKTNKWVCS